MVVSLNHHVKGESNDSCYSSDDETIRQLKDNNLLTVETYGTRYFQSNPKRCERKKGC